jgi:uncharacterized protein YoxC
MASKDASFANSSNLDRMGALAKWIAAKAEEMAQMDRKIERRLDHLQRSEDNLRAMFEAIRDQVSSAHAVSDDLRKNTSTATTSAEERSRDIDQAMQSALQKASSLVENVELRAHELEQTAQTIVQSTVDRLDELMEQAKNVKAAAEASQIVQPPPPQQDTQQSRFESDVVSVQMEFEQRAAAVIESIRRSAVDQIDRLGSQVAVAVDPVLARIDSQRRQAEAQLNAVMTAAEDSLRRRAEELGRAGDTSVDMIEQRLARRLDNVRPRTIQTLDVAERAMNQRLTALIDGAKQTVSATESDLTERVAQLAPRLNQTLQAVQDELVEQLARLEEHAFAMTGWLDQRMSERVDAMIARTRTALAQTPTTTPAPLSPGAVSLVCYADEYPAPAPPTSVDVQVFVDRRGDRTERGHRSTAASIFQ